jgi:hypothetical protein
LAAAAGSKQPPGMARLTSVAAGMPHLKSYDLICFDEEFNDDAIRRRYINI